MKSVTYATKCWKSIDKTKCASEMLRENGSIFRQAVAIQLEEAVEMGENEGVPICQPDSRSGLCSGRT